MGWLEVTSVTATSSRMDGATGVNPSSDDMINRLNTSVSSPRSAFGALLRVTVYRQSLDMAALSQNLFRLNLSPSGKSMGNRFPPVPVPAPDGALPLAPYHFESHRARRNIRNLRKDHFG